MLDLNPFFRRLPCCHRLRWLEAVVTKKGFCRKSRGTTGHACPRNESQLASA
jgi:hypothetical protein